MAKKEKLKNYKKHFEKKFSEFKKEYSGTSSRVEKIRKDELFYLDKLLRKINATPKDQAADMMEIFKFCCRNPLGVLHPMIGLNKNSLSWYPVIKPVLEEMEQMNDFLFQERVKKEVLPETESVWEFTKLFNVHDTRVVILGIATYAVPKAASGLAFSTKGSIDYANSLKRIYDALKNYPNVNFQQPNHRDLTAWASSQHVLLMDINLSVLCNPCISDPKSHSDDVLRREKGVTPGWGRLTGTIMKYINENCKNVVFMLWGEDAKELARENDVFTKETLDKLNNSIDRNDKGNLVVSSFHLMASKYNSWYDETPFDSFLHCHHFSACNDYLIKRKKSSIDWQIARYHHKKPKSTKRKYEQNE